MNYLRILRRACHHNANLPFLGALAVSKLLDRQNLNLHMKFPWILSSPKMIGMLRKTKIK